MDRRTDHWADPDTEWGSSLMNGDRGNEKRIAMVFILKVLYLFIAIYTYLNTF